VTPASQQRTRGMATVFVTGVVLLLACLWSLQPFAPRFDEPRSVHEFAISPVSTERAVLPAARGPYSLEGTVVDALFRRPIVGVTVLVVTEDPPEGVWSVTTDTNGRWAARNLPGGRFFAYVEPPGYKVATTGWPLIRLSDARPHRTVEIPVSRGTTDWNPDLTARSEVWIDELNAATTAGNMVEPARHSSVLAGTVAGTASIVMVLQRDDDGRITCAGWSGLREGEFEVPPLPAGRYRVIAVRYCCRPDSPAPLETFWARGTPVTLKDDEVRRVTLTAP